MVRSVSDGLRNEWNIRRNGSMLAGHHSDFSPVITPLKSHLAFAHFQSSRMILDHKTESRAYDNRFGVGCGENKWVMRALRLDCGFHDAPLQPHVIALFARFIDNDGVVTEAKL